MQDTESEIFSLLMSEGLFEYFQIMVSKSSRQLTPYPDELNIASVGYEKSKLESKGFTLSTEISEFPVRDQKVKLHI